MTARTFLDASQIALLLRLAEVERHPASPLPAGTAATVEDDAAKPLYAQGLIVNRNGATRTNLFFKEILLATAQPDEVLSLRATGAGAPGFTVCRRGRLWVECTQTPDGTTKLEYPLSRDAVVTAATNGLSGDREESPPVGFGFRGPAADGFVLSMIARGGRDGLAEVALDATMREYLTAHPGAGIATALADPRGVQALLDAPAATAVARLSKAGHVEARDNRLVASRAAQAVLRTPAEAGFSASRTSIAEPGIETVGIQVWRTDGRILVTRPVVLADGAPGVDWSDLQRAELRALVAAVFTPREALASLEA